MPLVDYVVHVKPNAALLQRSEVVELTVQYERATVPGKPLTDSRDRMRHRQILHGLSGK